MVRKKVEEDVEVVKKRAEEEVKEKAREEEVKCK